MHVYVDVFSFTFVEIIFSPARPYSELGDSGIIDIVAPLSNWWGL